ncbi:NitT/TauT family transport system substrate-binding protein [Tardiphaga sp. OK246]|jgi:NitT/TauT family transport system substrate-binding protein|uniref:ABC transporter substrate-binding protein n=1 Tax=Tardiphaga sp. OK246 TaxID=1855307 RepID=UPI000B647002|nr:ABC transporter substrate-binding protein [Tardiphaga sp. OK246]SNS46339.1 NitT/TauT family transport system substrate-binding protein [Tardiphaga sp. OK246]
MTRRTRGFALAFSIALATIAISQSANAQTKLRFTLDWAPGATHSPFFVALQKGYYKAEGLDVSIDRGKGSAEVVRQLAAGTYDMGFPDINVVMDFNSKNPEQAFPVLLSGYEEAPAALIFLKSSGMTEPKQLNGKKLGSAANDSTFKLLPLFAKQTGIDMATLQIQNIEPSLREVLLAQGKVDAIPGQVFNSLLELQAKGIKESEIGYFMYKDYGLELYGNSVAASPAFLKANPEAVKGFLRATIKGLKEVAADPELGVKAAMAFEPLLNADIERERLRVAMKCCIVTDTVRKKGFGEVDKDRLQKVIEIITKAYNLPRQPALAEVYDASYLPPAQDRMLK